MENRQPSSQPLSTVAMSERNNYDYVYIDEKNRVHILCPITAGDSIGLDNTCKSTKEIKRFFGQGLHEGEEAALDVLTRYKSDLEADIALLKTSDAYNEIRSKKEERLKQVQQYLECLEAVEPVFKIEGVRGSAAGDLGVYPQLVKDLLAQRTNCLPVLLSPRNPDHYLNASNATREHEATSYVFSLKRSGMDYHDREETPVLQPVLQDLFSQIPTKAAGSIKDIILSEIEKELGAKEEPISDERIKEIIKLLEKKIYDKTGESVKLSTAMMSGTNYTISKQFFADIMGDENNSPKGLADSILKLGTSEQFWARFSVSKFNEAAALPDDPDNLARRAEILSTMTQFFLAEVNVFCYANNKSKRNFGKVLEEGASSNQLIWGLTSTISHALANNLNVEEQLIAFINNNQNDFGLSGPISPAEAKQIIERFNVEYATVKDGPHMDEFTLFLSDAPGRFVGHHNRMSFNFLHFAESFAPQLLQPPERQAFVQAKLKEFSENHEQAVHSKKLPPKNDVGPAKVDINLANLNLSTLSASDKQALLLLMVKNNDTKMIAKIIQAAGNEVCGMIGEILVRCREHRVTSQSLTVFIDTIAPIVDEIAWAVILASISSVISFPEDVKKQLSEKIYEKIGEVQKKDAVLYRLVMVGKEELIKEILERGANPNVAFGDSRTTPLMKALLYSEQSDRYNRNIVHELLSHGADPNLKDNDDSNALMAACALGHFDIAAELLDREDVKRSINLQNKYKNAALSLAIAYGASVELIGKLLDSAQILLYGMEVVIPL